MNVSVTRNLRGDLDELERRRAARPLDFAQRLEWQEVAWALIGGGEWKSEWGPPPCRAPKGVGVVLANRGGKTTFSAQVGAGHATGRLPRWQRQGKLWTGMPSLADSVGVHREYLAQWIGREEIASWRHRDAERDFLPFEQRGTAEELAALRRDLGWRSMPPGYGICSLADGNRDSG